MRSQLEEFVRQSIDELLKKLPLAKRLEGLSLKERLEGLSPEERLKVLSPEQRLQGLSPEERLEGLSQEELRIMLEVLQRLLQANGPSSKPAP